MAEFDLEICYRPGRKHGNADALSRSPVDGCAEKVTGEVNHATAVDLRDDEKEIDSLQREDPSFAAILAFLEHDTLPSDEKLAKGLALERTRYAVLDGVLYRVDDHCNRMAVPAILKEKLMKEAHAGSVSGHFALLPDLVQALLVGWDVRGCSPVLSFVSDLCIP